MSHSRFKVTVYIPSRNYGQYLGEAVESVLSQNFTGWELIIVDEASTDDTWQQAQAFEARYPDRIRAVRNPTPQGLFKVANQTLEMARGEYFVRLDADDYFDESALLVMAGYLDANPETALVFPNFFYVDKDGQYPRAEWRKKIGVETKLLDLPAHGACTMVRTRVLKAVGGYSDDLKAQDGHELWLKIARRYQVANISTPLFFYRQHDTSLSRNQRELLANRQKIKRTMVDREQGAVRPRVVAVVPAKNTWPGNPNIVLRPIAGKPLIDHTLDCALKTGFFSAIVVNTDDPAVVEHCQRRGDVQASLRPEVLRHHDTRLERVIHDAVVRLETEEQLYPDAIVVLSVHCPLRRPEHIIEALDTLLLYDADSVISVVEDWNVHYTHALHGLQVLNPGMTSRLRLEREALFVDNGAIKAMWRDVVSEDDMLGRKISHIVMAEEDNFVSADETSIRIIENELLRRSGAARVAKPVAR